MRTVNFDISMGLPQQNQYLERQKLEGRSATTHVRLTKLTSSMKNVKLSTIADHIDVKSGTYYGSLNWDHAQYPQPVWPLFARRHGDYCMYRDSKCPHNCSKSSQRGPPSVLAFLRCILRHSCRHKYTGAHN